MKRMTLPGLLLLVASAAAAQVSVQMHYDLGRKTNPRAEADRPQLTTTVEMFKADRLGGTFLFVDMDYLSDGVDGAYWEVSRDFTLARPGRGGHSLSAHAEYDGGLSIGKDYAHATRFQQCALAGPAWQWSDSGGTLSLTLQALFKQYFANRAKGLGPHASFQLTPVWSWTAARGWLTLSGFADLWYGYRAGHGAGGRQEKGLVFLAEPQLWVNVMCRSRTRGKLSVGTEWELSDHFVWSGTGRSFFWNPTLALKWDI